MSIDHLRGKAAVLSAIRLCLRSSLNAAIAELNASWASDPNGDEGLSSLALAPVAAEDITIRVDGTLHIEPSNAPLIRITPGFGSEFQRMTSSGGQRTTGAVIWVYAANEIGAAPPEHIREEQLLLLTQGYLSAITAALDGRVAAPDSPGLDCFKGYGIHKHEEVGSDIRIVTAADSTPNTPLVLAGIYTILVQQHTAY